MRDPYLIKSVAHAAQLLAAFEAPGEALSPREISARTGLSRGIVHRLLYTLGHHHVVEHMENNRYRPLYRRLTKTLWRIGYGAPGIDTLFTRAVTQSLRIAADRGGEIEILTLDHCFKPDVALHNAAQFIRERVELVIDYQIDEQVGAVTANLFREANIPVIVINNPQPGATYFGANNYEAGLIGGRYLGKWARARWLGEVDQIVMLDLCRAGTVPRTRLAGMVYGIREILGQVSKKIPVVYLDGGGRFESSWQAMRKHLRTGNRHRTLIGAVNDNSALGALRAFEEAGRAEDCAVMGQNGALEARKELRKNHSRLIGSVAYFPEKYGDGLVQLALDLLNRRFVAPAIFTPHKLLTSHNVDHIYPNDSLMGYQEVLT
ncbi:MAG TPA: substrate-binding domain-containing protein [Alloacidobacterium sp.]|nr:substrate-binding domain-containing protein [Alloacidobacterium sp.]